MDSISFSGTDWRFRPASRRRAFTLIELLVGMAVLALLIFLVASLIGSTSRVWQRSEARVGAFQAARTAFETMTRSLSQATLNPYWDYVDASGAPRTEANKTNFVPASYRRASDLHFLSVPANALSSLPAATHPGHAVFYQIPGGYADDSTFRPLGNLLNSVGYFVEFGSDRDLGLRPSFLPGSDKYRYRLLQMLEPSEDNSVYLNPDAPWEWIENALNVQDTPRPVRPVADNIIALLALPRNNPDDASSLAPNFEYDSRNDENPVTLNQLPPYVELIMVAIDEPSAARLAEADGANPPDFGLDNLFHSAAKLETDLETLETTLREKHIDYRVFRTTVRIDSSRWSQ